MIVSVPVLTRSVVVGLIAAHTGLSVARGETRIDFHRDVRPILAENCFQCHGFDEHARKGGLRLDDAQAATRPAESGEQAIVPGKPDESPFIVRITSSDDTERMPPPSTDKRLTREQVETLRRWITEGAAYAQHWSFERPVQGPRPAVRNAAWPRTEIDYFVLARLDAEGLSPAPTADKSTLARRIALDLTGLPPEPNVLQAFLRDDSPRAYELYVDALLASPHFGERWARHWLDLGRYADTKGYEKDLARQMWRWRDWVIAAFNADMPYDQFTREQLAGDLLPEATRDQILATAFHRNTMANDEGGTDDEEFRVAAVKDRVDTTIQAWMGLTIGCAKCHSHKYDPISISDYYRFYAFFNQTEDADRFDDAPKVPMPTPDEEERLARLKTELAAADRRLKTPTRELEAGLPAWETDTRTVLDWQIVKPATAVATSGASLEIKDDGSLLVKGTAPKIETYVLRFAAPVTKLTGVRLEALPDPANPKGGAGRALDGRFVLSQVRLAARTPDGKTFEVPFASAAADFSQQDLPIESVLNNSEPKKKGWGVAPRQTEPHQAVFTTINAHDMPAGTELTLTLDHEFEFLLAGLSLGRFRIACTDAAVPAVSPPVPDDVLALLRVPAEQRITDQQQRLLEHYATVAPGTQPLRDEIAKLKEQLAAIQPAETPILRELPAEKRRVTRMQQRGNFLEPGDQVVPGTPGALHRFPEAAPQNRLGVADWLTSRENPLTARVAANRVWAHLFGRGIVETEEDFGASGTTPTHPELLDWLAVDFMEHGWSFKRLVKAIVMSATYRQSARVSPKLLARDRDNRLLARGPRFRLEAEMIRDQALAVSGLLSRTLGGPSVMPYQPEGLWKSTYNNAKWETSAGENRWRRGLYTYQKRTTPYPQMVTFDGTSRETCTIRRIRTNTPLQALVTLNDPVFVECAQSLARNMAANGGSRVEDRIAWGWRQALLREGRPAEIAALVALYTERLAEGRVDPDAARTLASEPLGPLPADADPAQLAALTATANVILNLDEFLTKP